MSSPFKKYNRPPFKKGQSSPGGNGVLYLNQFPKNFLRPYGAVDQAPTEDVVFRRVSPASCEWLKRPKVAMSEMAETLTTNICWRVKRVNYSLAMAWHHMPKK